jgi:hypothetical protein
VGEGEYGSVSGGTNTTESFAQEFFGGFLGMSQDGSPNDKKDQLITNLARGIAVEQRDFYKVGDLTISTDKSDAVLKFYGNKLVESIASYPSIDIEKALIAFLTALNNGDTASSEELQHQGDLYKKISDEMTEISVPQELSILHLALVNTYRGTGIALSDMSFVTKDSLRALTGFASYQENIDVIQTIFSGIAKIFEEQNITFTEQEAGYVFQTI